MKIQFILNIEKNKKVKIKKWNFKDKSQNQHCAKQDKSKLRITNLGERERWPSYKRIPQDRP